MSNLKKTAIAMAVAGAMSVSLSASADVTIKGIMSLSIDFADTVGGALNDGTSMNSNQSSIGFKWSEDLGNGNKVIGFVDFSFKPDSPGGGDAATARDQYVGFTGDWGQIVFGATSSSWKTSAKIDPLWRTSMQARGNLDQISALTSGAGTKNGVNRGRVNDMIRYTSPNMSGFKAIGWVSLDDSAGDDHNWGAGLHYKNGPLFASIDYLQAGQIAGSEDDAFKIGAKYKFDQFAVWGSYSMDGGAISCVEGLGVCGTTDDADIFYLGASAAFGNNDVTVTYGDRDDSQTTGAATSNGDSKDAWGITLRHHMSKRTFVYAGYGEDDRGSASTDLEFATVGVRHKF